IAQTSFLWGTTIPFNASFGIPQGWLAQLRAGSYLGRPLSPEVPLPNAPANAVFQVFERGLATFLPGQTATFNGGALTDGQLGDIAQTPFLWRTNTPFVPRFAIPRACLVQLRAGRYAGRPLSSEAP